MLVHSFSTFLTSLPDLSPWVHAQYGCQGSSSDPNEMVGTATLVDIVLIELVIHVLPVLLLFACSLVALE